MTYSWIFTLLLIFLPVLKARDAFFDCNRNNIDCGAGGPGTCGAPGGATEGECTCTGAPASESANADNACFDPDDTSSVCADDTICNGNGDCKKVEGGADTCFCNDDFWGTTCDKERIVVTCSATDMKVEITPFGSNGDGTVTTFAGQIYASGQFAITDCKFGAQTGTVATFEQTFPYTGGPCGVQTTTPTIPTDPTVYGIVLRVQHNQDMLVNNDLKVTARCSIGPSGVVVAGTGIITALDANLPNDKTKDEVTSLVQLDLLMSNDGTTFDQDANGAAVTIGTDMHLRFFLPSNNGPGFTTFLVQQCVGQNSAENPTKQVQIVDTNGCPVYSKPTVTADHSTTAHDTTNNNQINGQDGTSVSVPIKIFKFPGVDSVFFSCTVLTCTTATAASGDCNAPGSDTCTAPFTAGLGRRRREAGAESNNVQARVRVFSSDDEFNTVNRTVSQDGDRAPSSIECLQEPTTQSIIFVLGVALLVLLIACIVITACLLRRNRRNKGDNFDQGSTASSTTHLSIPRPRI